MSALTRRFLATAAVFVALGIGLGLTMLVRRELLGDWPTRGLISAHVHLLMVGAVLELIIGVAWWLFPRPIADQPPASPALVTVAWWLLTIGTALRAFGEIAAQGVAGTAWATWIVGGGTLQVIGIGAAIAALRRRVRPGARG